MKTLREYVREAKRDKRAVGHFNFSNLEGLHAIARAAKGLNLPVIVGLSEGEQDAVGTYEAVALVRTIREEWDLPIFLNADHHYSFATVKVAIDAGFDSVIFDGAKLSFEENVAQSKQCVDYARTVSTATGRDIIVEIELGYIGEGSMLRDSAPAGVTAITDPADAIRFMKETGADMLAPAVGTFHGMLKVGDKPRLNIESIKALAAAIDHPMVLHGGSGNEADFAAAIEAGISIVHVNTEIRRAYTDALRVWLTQHPDEVAPYKYGLNAALAMEAVVADKLKIFNRIA